MRFPWTREESELDEELGFHLEQLAAKFEAEGMTKKEALRKARKEFGVMEKVKDECRDESRWKWLAELRQDVAFGWRMLRKTPVVTAAAVLSLALGIGSGTAIVSLMKVLLWQEMGVPEPEQVSWVVWRAVGRPEGIYNSSSGSMFPDGAARVADFFSYASFEAMRDKAAGKAELAGFLYSEQVSIGYQGRTAVVQSRAVSGEFFKVLRLQPPLGRSLRPDDDQSGAAAVVVVTHRFWEKHLGASKSAVGQVIRVNNRPYEVVGVLPQEFQGISSGDPTDLFVCFRQSPFLLNDPGNYSLSDAKVWWVELVARRAPGVGADDLEGFLDGVFRSTWSGQIKKEETAPHVKVLEGKHGLWGLKRQIEKPLYVILSLVGLVLLIACANIANLQLARAEARRKEVALRISLGCAQLRLVRQFLTESVLLAALGAAASLGFAFVTANLLLTLVPGPGGDLDIAVPLDLWMLAATMGVSALTVFLFGVFPAWRAAQVDAAPALKEGAGSAGGAADRWWTPGKVLLVAQVAFALVLLVTAVVFTRNLQKIMSQDAGFERGRMLLFDVSPGQIGYQKERLTAFYTRLEQELKAVAGVESAGLAALRPMAHRGNWDSLYLPGTTREYNVAVSRGSGGLQATVGIKILGGRAIDEGDLSRQAKVAVVSEALAKKLSPGGYPLGQEFSFEPGGKGTRYQIVGVASNAAYSELTDRPDVLYVPSDFKQDSMTVILRTSVGPLQVLPAVREVVRRLEPNLPMIGVQSMEGQIAEGLKTERMFAYLCGGFGLLALALLVVGLYGVMAYATERRQNEMGIRMALGATREQVLGLVLGDGLRLVSLGLLLGAPVIWYGSRFVEKLLFEMKPLDPVSLGSAAGVLGLAAFLATLVPAWRAAAMDPHTALRRE